MTFQRTDRVYLDPAESRCEPGRPCTVRSRCVRGIAALPATGAVLEDFCAGDNMRQLYGGTILCPGFLSAEVARKEQSMAPPKPYVKGLT